MALNKAKGNMYNYITHTWNPIKGKCSHRCSYCYMTAINKRFNNIKNSIYLDEKELKTNLGHGNFIFVGSSTDMWADNIPDEWILRVLDLISKHYDNTYLFQSKNPKRFIEFFLLMPRWCHLGTTIETNRQYGYMGNTPSPEERALILREIKESEKTEKCKTTFITIEPIIDFDPRFIEILRHTSPHYVNIGADSGNNHLPEPPKEKIIELIGQLETFTKVHKKPNLARLLGAL
jgi:DNA repair photolyase